MFQLLLNHENLFIKYKYAVILLAFIVRHLRLGKYTPVI